MNIAQPYKVGDKVMAPSISFIIKQNSNESKFVPATIVFAHPTNGWCSYRYDRVNVVSSYFNDMIFTMDGYEKYLEESLKAAEALMANEDDDDDDSFKESSSDEIDDEPDDFDESIIDDDDDDEDNSSDENHENV